MELPWTIGTVVTLAGGLYYVYHRAFVVLPEKIATNFPKLTMTSFKKVLIISPHPDDESIACAGLIQKLLQKNIDFRLVLLTFGGKRFVQGTKKTRKLEFEKVLSTLRVPSSSVIYADLPDGFLGNHVPELTQKLTQIIGEFKPDAIVYPHPLDGNADHTAVGKLTEKLVPQNIIHLRYLIHYWRYPRPYSYQPDHYIVPPGNVFKKDPKWVSFALTQQQIKTKSTAINCYRTQLRIPGLNQLLRAFIRRNEIFSLK